MKRRCRKCLNINCVLVTFLYSHIKSRNHTAHSIPVGCQFRNVGQTSLKSIVVSPVSDTFDFLLYDGTHCEDVSLLYRQTRHHECLLHGNKSNPKLNVRHLHRFSPVNSLCATCPGSSDFMGGSAVWANPVFSCSKNCDCLEVFIPHY